MVLKDILDTKTVAVWGLGYLGYTTILKLQQNGFKVLVYDLNTSQLKQFMSGKYPDKKRIAYWSHMGYSPKVDFDKIKVVRNPEELFRSSCVHMIAMPDRKMIIELAHIFARNLRRRAKPPLIVFESAFIPGHIENGFIKYLKEKNLTCSRDYYVGAIFRTDWSIEAFISQKEKIPVAGYCDKSLKIMRAFFAYLGVPTITLDSLKEAEIYVNSFNTIQTMVNNFVRQLSFGYPAVNIKNISKLLFKNLQFDDCDLNIGTGGEKMTLALDYLIEGSDNPGSLTMLKEFQEISISSVLTYAEYIMRHGYKSVSIMGLTYKGNQKDLTLSPSVTLADYLIKNGIKVSINDPLFTKEEITSLVKRASVIDFPRGAFLHEVLVLASDHNSYAYLSQSILDTLKKKTKLIIDNYGIWSHLSFGKSIIYHQVGDGRLNLLR